MEMYFGSSAKQPLIESEGNANTFKAADPKRGSKPESPSTAATGSPRLLPPKCLQPTQGGRPRGVDASSEK